MNTYTPLDKLTRPPRSLAQAQADITQQRDEETRCRERNQRHQIREAYEATWRAVSATLEQLEDHMSIELYRDLVLANDLAAAAYPLVAI